MTGFDHLLWLAFLICVLASEWFRTLAKSHIDPRKITEEDRELSSWLNSWTGRSYRTPNSRNIRPEGRRYLLGERISLGAGAVVFGLIVIRFAIR